jgi:hypothetical protein
MMPYFNRFDVCEAYYMYACLYHNGQWSKEYKIFGRLHKIKFKPASSLTVETLDENARLIFDNLVAKAGFEPYA